MHHLQLAEAFPLAPGGAGILTGLATLFTVILWAIAIGLLIVWRRTVGALFEHLADLLDRASIHTGLGTIRPFGFVSGALREADWAVQQGLDDAVHGTERAIVYLWGATTWFFRLTGHMIRGLAHDVEVAFHWIEHHRIPRAIALALIPPLAAIVAVRHLVHVLEHTLVRPLIPRVGRLEHTLEHDFGIARRGIDVTRRDLARAEKDVARLGGRVHALEKRLGVGVFAGAVAVALGTLGLGFLRCPSFLRMGRRLGCGGFALLEDLLFTAGAVFALSDLCRFAGLVTATAEEIRPLLLDLVDVEEALLGCHGATKPDPLSIPSYRLPPTNAGLPLAA